MAGEANRTRNHDEIRRWVEERGGRPATVTRTERGGDAGVLRIDFPGYSGEATLQPISWDEFFQKFDESNLEFLYQDTAANGEPSRFNKFVTAGTESGARTRAMSAARRGTSTRRTSTARKSTTSRRSASARKGATARKRTSRSKTNARSTTKRATARKASGRTRAATTRKSTSGRRTTGSASAGTRGGTATKRRSTGTTQRRSRRTEAEEPLVIGTFISEPVPTDEVIRLEDEGPVSGNAPSVTETDLTRNRRRRSDLERGTNPGTP